MVAGEKVRQRLQLCATHLGVVLLWGQHWGACLLLGVNGLRRGWLGGASFLLAVLGTCWGHTIGDRWCVLIGAEGCGAVQAEWAHRLSLVAGHDDYAYAYVPGT